MTTGKSDPDFAADVVADLYRYRPKQYGVVVAIALIGGIFGAHRFYLGKVASGLAMMLSGGGGLVWWIVDLMRLRQMVQQHNDEEAQREATGIPPQGMGFLPPREELDIERPPSWAEKRGSRSRLIGSALLLGLIGFTLGVVSGATSVIEPTVTLVAFVVVTLTAARLPIMDQIPLLRGVTRWSHRLRLYYHTTDPGNFWLLALRPLTGVFYALWIQRTRAEVRLYLQMGVAFAICFALLDVAEALQLGSFWAGIGLMIGEFAQTLVYTYVFVAPAGALLTTQLLLSRRDSTVLGLSAITLAAVAVGLRLVGAI